MASEHRNALPSGYQLEEYMFERVLGAGGFGITYLAHEKTLKRKVAIKEFLPRDIAVRGNGGITVHPVSSSDLEDYEYGLERFRDEARTLVSFRHPNIVAVHRLLEANNTAYLVMEYEEGDSLFEILERDHTLTETEVKEILFPLLDGLSRVHMAGFLHRDIKPANIYVRRDGSPVLIDFGAARQAIGERSRSITAIVSTGYAPMEQYSIHGKQGAYSDLYALAATAYKALTGKRPPDAVQRVANDPYTPAVVAGRGNADVAFLEAIDWALVMDAEDRPQSVDAWLTALQGQTPSATIVASSQSATDLPQAPDEESTQIRPTEKSRRGAAPWLIGGGIALVISAAVAGGWYLYDARETERLEIAARLSAERKAAEQKKAEEVRQKAAEEARRIAAEIEQRRVRAEAQRKKEEAARRKAAEDARRKAAVDARRKAAVDDRRKAAVDARRKAAVDDRRKAAADARRKAAEDVRRKAAQRASRGAAVQLRIAIINKCYKSINVVYRYRQANGAWITRGWQRILNGRTKSWNIRATSRIFYVYAESYDRRFTWSGKNRSGSISAPVVYRKFAHTKGPLYGPGRKTVLFARNVISSKKSAFNQSYTCK
ncbi:MAG: protein kinase [Alphaproteobacteria bacterium]|nr:protein kinase [Alphaproteobacteria bacterium]